MPVMALQNIPNVTFRMPIYESYLPVCRDSSASLELTRYLGYQADTESTASAVSSVGKRSQSVNTQITDDTQTSRISHSLNPETLSSLPVTTKVPQV